MKKSVSLREVSRTAVATTMIFYGVFLFSGDSVRSIADTAESALSNLTASVGIGLSCEADASGDSSSAGCSVETGNAEGYTLDWRVETTGSGSSASEHVIGQLEDMIHEDDMYLGGRVQIDHSSAQGVASGATIIFTATME